MCRVGGPRGCGRGGEGLELGMLGVCLVGGWVLCIAMQTVVAIVSALVYMWCRAWIAWDLLGDGFEERVEGSFCYCYLVCSGDLQE